MNQTIEAIFENGVFMPLKPNLLGLKDGERVIIVIKTTDEAVDAELSLTEKYFKDLSEADIDKVITSALNQNK